MNKNELYKKYGIDSNKLKEIKNFNISKETLEKLENTTNKFLPVIWTYEFEKLVNDIDNENYSDAYSSNVFKTILEVCKKENTISLKRGSNLFRARIVDEKHIYEENYGIGFKDGRLNGYDWINSKEPPLGLSPDGRANSKYTSYFYCANDGNTAASEIKANIGDFISLASFKTNRNMKIIDFSMAHTTSTKAKSNFYIEKLVERFSKPIKNLKEYRFTQFISDEIRKCGVDGICYTSYFTQSLNYVIFNCATTSIKFVSSRILKLHSQQLNFIDYSSEKIRSTKLPNNMSSDEIFKEKLEIINTMNFVSNLKKNKENEKNK